MFGKFGEFAGVAKNLAGSALTEFTAALDDSSEEEGGRKRRGEVSPTPSTPEASEKVVYLGPLNQPVPPLLKLLGCDSESEARDLLAAIRLRLSEGTHNTPPLLPSVLKRLCLCDPAALDALQAAHEEEISRLRLKTEALLKEVERSRSTSDSERKQFESQIETCNNQLRDLREQSIDFKKRYEEQERLLARAVDEKSKLAILLDETGKVDGSVVKALLVQLGGVLGGSNQNELRVTLLEMLSELLGMDANDRIAIGLPERPWMDPKGSLADEFVSFLERDF